MKNQNLTNADLERQREYINKFKSTHRPFSLVAAEAFVRGMRQNGYKSTATAIHEFDDNSIQAQATQIDLILGYDEDNASKKKLDKFAIVDNGHGMDPDMIRLAILWGGTHRENDRTGFGRFGFGLPSAAVSIAKCFSVYSKTPGGKWHGVTVDLGKMEKGAYINKEGYTEAPEPIEATPPAWLQKWLPSEHGTIVLLEELDQLSAGFGTSLTFRRRMLHDLGLVYRASLGKNKMRVIDPGADDGTVWNVEPIDPLFLTEGARYYDENELRAEGLPSIMFQVPDGKDRIRGTVRVRFSYLAPGFQDGTGPRGLAEGRFPVMRDNNGIIVLRAGRQVDVITQNPWDVAFQAYERNTKVEIDFEPTLDEDFGVTTNKQQISISEGIWHRLKENGVHAALSSMRKRYRQAIKDQDAQKEQDASKLRASEEAMAEAEKFNTSKAATPTPEKEQQSQKRLDQEVKKQTKETGKPPSEIVEDLLKQKYRVLFENAPGAPFFRPDQVGGQKRVYINTSHRFYSDLYNGTTASVKAALEILMFILATCELDAEGDREQFYKRERSEWSNRFETALELNDRKRPIEDAKAAAEADKEEGLSTEQVPVTKS